jgi:3-deoxy-D-arabino-heptulosonate 7-phosphate (DAHP) synthase class II
MVRERAQHERRTRALRRGVRPRRAAGQLDLLLLLRLIDKAVSERRGPLRHTVSAASHGIRLLISPAEGDTVVAAKSGTLRLAGLSLEVERVTMR